MTTILPRIRRASIPLKGIVLSCLLLMTFLQFPGKALSTEAYLDIRSTEVRRISLAVPYFDIDLSHSELISLRNKALKILTFDLRESGLFQLIDVSANSAEINATYRTKRTLPYTAWYMTGVQAIVVGDITKEGEEIILNASLFDTKMQLMMTGKRYRGKASLFRQMVHKFADEVVFRFTGERGIAHTRIVYVRSFDKRKELEIMDYDGYQIIPLTGNNSINLSPDWSFDDRYIYFTSYAGGAPAVYRVGVKNRKVFKIASFSGLNGTPAVSPDNKKLALTLSKDGNSEIYVMELRTRSLTRLTFHRGIDTSPAWSPTGRELVFTSDRAGSPQLYIMDAEGMNLRRLTYRGNYNDSADWSPQGNVIVYCSRENGRFSLYTITVEGSKSRQVASGKGSLESPSWSPDGNFIVYSETLRDESSLYVIDRYGHNKRRLTFQEGNFTSPDWSH